MTVSENNNNNSNFELLALHENDMRLMDEWMVPASALFNEHLTVRKGQLLIRKDGAGTGVAIPREDEDYISLLAKQARWVNDSRRGCWTHLQQFLKECASALNSHELSLLEQFIFAEQLAEIRTLVFKGEKIEVRWKHLELVEAYAEVMFDRYNVCEVEYSVLRVMRNRIRAKEEELRKERLQRKADSESYLPSESISFKKGPKYVSKPKRGGRWMRNQSNRID